LDVGYESVKGFEAGAETVGIATVAEKHVRVNEIGEDDSGRGLIDLEEGAEDAFLIGLGGDGLGHSSMGENVTDLANSDGVISGVERAIEECGLGTLDAVVAAIASPTVVSILADEWTGYDPSDLEGADAELAGFLAEFVEAVERHDLLMGGDLENTVGAGVDNGPTRGDMLRAQALNDLGTAGGDISEGADAEGCFETLNKLGRKSIGKGGKRLGADHTGNLPVAEGGVLGTGLLDHAPVAAGGRMDWLDSADGADIAETKFGHVG
jgi:hypothetical protein